MKTRFRFSLRTLLLASLAMGGAMSVWRVREPWTLRTVPIADLHPPEKNDCLVDLEFSSSGRFLSGEPMHLFADRFVNPRFILDTATLRVVDDFKASATDHWHPTRDLFIRELEKPQYRVYDCAARKPLFECRATPGCIAAFSPGGKYVVELDSENKRLVRIVCDTQSWQPLAGFPLDGSEVSLDLSRDDRWLAVASHTSKFGFAIGEVDTETRQWRWKQPVAARGVMAIDLNFSSDSTTVDVMCQCYARRNIVDAEIDANAGTGGSAPYLFHLAADSGNEMLRDASGKEYETAREALLKKMEMAISVISRPIPAVETINSPDGSLNLIQIKGEKEILLRDAKSGRPLGSLAFNGEIRSEIHISKDNLRIAAGTSTKDLAIWTRQRQHFEWWGLYERWESWLALALFAAFSWSFIRDIKALRHRP